MLLRQHAMFYLEKEILGILREEGSPMHHQLKAIRKSPSPDGAVASPAWFHEFVHFMDVIKRSFYSHLQYVITNACD